MAINVPNAGNYLSDISQKIAALRDAFQGSQGIVNANNYLVAMGGTAFLTALPPNGIGMSGPDASALVAALGNLATQPALVSALANSETAWGGL
jgi:hypothetical protein